MQRTWCWESRAIADGGLCKTLGPRNFCLHQVEHRIALLMKHSSVHVVPQKGRVACGGDTQAVTYGRVSFVKLALPKQSFRGTVKCYEIEMRGHGFDIILDAIALSCSAPVMEAAQSFLQPRGERDV